MMLSIYLTDLRAYELSNRKIKCNLRKQSVIVNLCDRPTKISLHSMVCSVQQLH